MGSRPATPSVASNRLPARVFKDGAPYGSPAGLPILLRVNVRAISTAFRGPLALAMRSLRLSYTFPVPAALVSAVRLAGQLANGADFAQAVGELEEPGNLCPQPPALGPRLLVS